MGLISYTMDPIAGLSLLSAMALLDVGLRARLPCALASSVQITASARSCPGQPSDPYALLVS